VPVASSALEAVVRPAVVDQVSDAVHAVLDERGGGEDEHAGLGIDEGDDVQGGHEPGELAEIAEVFECFHGSRAAMSTGASPRR
jgi:hypothetical protein